MTDRPHRHLVDLGGGTVGGLIAHRAAAQPDKTAVSTPRGSLTYGQLDAGATIAAAGLASLGLVPGDRVALFMRNRVEWIAAWAAIARGGFVCVPINLAYKGAFLEHALTLTGVRAIVTEAACLEALTGLGDAVSTLEHVLTVDATPPLPAAPFALVGWDELLLEASGDYVAPQVAPDAIAMVALTSGTTGRSKGVVCPHRMMVVAARENLEAMGTTSRDRLYTCLPLFHGAALMNIVLHGIYAGATVVVAERFSASGFWDDVRTHRITMFNALGSVLPMLLAQPPREDDRDNPVRRVFAAPAPSDVLLPFEDRFDVHVVEGYGLSEIKNVAYNPIEGRRIGSVGKPTATTLLQVQGPDGEPLPPGAVGEIVYRPATPGVMFTHYTGDPEATMSTIRNLWWCTGDLGYMDDDGFYYFIDRKKDALRRRGENISSYEVESVLMAFPGVLEAAAVATPSDLGEDEVLAVIETPRPEALDLDALFTHCDDHLPHFMVPRFYRVVATLPRTPTGKVRKAVLRSEGLVERTWDSRAAGRTPTRPAR